MRVTTGSMVNKLLININRNLERIHDKQDKLSTGKKLFRPSDDPIGVSRSLSLRQATSDVAQYKKNIENSLGWLDTTQSLMASAHEVLQKVREITVQAANDTYSADQRGNMGDEIAFLRDSLLDLANGSYGGLYIFSGARTNSPAFDNANFSYNGDETPFIRELSKGMSSRINATGSEVFLVDPQFAYSEVNNSIFTTLQDLSNILTQERDSGVKPPASDISAYLTQLDQSMNNIMSKISDVATKINRLDDMYMKHDELLINLTGHLSKNEDADISRVITELRVAESVYESSLAAAARIVQPSLMDFLR